MPVRRLSLVFAAALVGCTPQRHTPDAVVPPSLNLDEATAHLGVGGATNAGAGVAAMDDRVVVTWASTAGDQTNVFAATSLDEGRTFAAPVRVNDIEDDARMSGEQAPRASFGRDLIVGWISRTGGQSSIRVARSTDSGRTFTPARTVHASKLAGMRGWPSFALGEGDVVHAAWLDTRVAASTPAVHAASPEGHGGHHGSTRQDLYHAFAAPGGTWSETTIASDVCFCCKTAVTTGPDGTVYVAFRNVYPTNFRDMAVTRSNDGGRTFSAPVRVSEDHWQIDACPEDGPSLAVTDDGVLHMAWPTMPQQAEPRKAVFYASSSDGGRTFTPRVRVDQAADRVHAGHPQIASSGARVFVTWDETTGAGYKVQLREVGPDAESSRVITLSDVSSALYPAIAATDDTVVAAWTERSAERSMISVRRIALR